MWCSNGDSRGRFEECSGVVGREAGRNDVANDGLLRVQREVVEEVDVVEQIFRVPRDCAAAAAVVVLGGRCAHWVSPVRLPIGVTSQGQVRAWV